MNNAQVLNSQNAALQRGVTVWFTGLPSSGKSTIARLVERQCRKWKLKVELLDGDVVRTNLSKGLSFSKEDREINVKRIAFVCQLLTRNDVLAIASAISPYRETREQARQMIGSFLEVYVKTSLQECEKRDVKGLYQKARSGEVTGMTGVDDPYEAPVNPEVICETEKETPEECAAKVVEKLRDLGYLNLS